MKYKGILYRRLNGKFIQLESLFDGGDPLVSEDIDRVRAENEELKRQVKSLKLYMKDTVILRKGGEWATNMSSSGEAETAILRAAHKFDNYKR